MSGLDFEGRPSKNIFGFGNCALNEGMMIANSMIIFG